MERHHAVLLLLAAASLCVSANPFDQIARHARDHVKNAQRSTEHVKRSFECRQLNWTCEAFPKCCGSLQCYWEDGFIPGKNGICVECVEEGQSCIRQENCCQGLQCNKGHMFDVNSICRPKRPAGAECVENEQCETSCDKKWYQWKGRCVHITVE